MRRLLFLLFLGAATPCAAEVVSASDNGFEVRDAVTLVVPPDEAFSDFQDVGGWWDPQHTYSGKAENLSLNLVPGGCFCEHFPKGGGIEHLHVTYVDPGSRAILTGSLGPLLYEATNGVMDVQVRKVAGGAQLVIDYKVAGFAKGGAAKLATAVDQVLAAQLKRYREYAASRPKT